MIYPPLIAFFLALAWMVWRGYEAKRKYLQHKAAERQKDVGQFITQSQVYIQEYAYPSTQRSQGQVPELAETFGRSTQEKNPRWKM